MAHAVFKVRGKEIASLNLTGPTMIGRSAECRVCVQDTGISRRHLRLQPGENDTWFAVDLKSANGTFVDGERIERHQLTDGDLIDVGNLTVVFFEDSLPAGGSADSQTPYVICQSSFAIDHTEHKPLPTFEHAGDTIAHAPPAPKPAAQATPPVAPKPKWDEVQLVDHGRRHHHTEEESKAPVGSRMPKGVAIAAAAVIAVTCFFAAFYVASMLMG